MSYRRVFWNTHDGWENAALNAFTPRTRTTSLLPPLPSNRSDFFFSFSYNWVFQKAPKIQTRKKVLLKTTLLSPIICFFHVVIHNRSISTFRFYGSASLLTTNNLVKLPWEKRDFTYIMISCTWLTNEAIPAPKRQLAVSRHLVVTTRRMRVVWH